MFMRNAGGESSPLGTVLLAILACLLWSTAFAGIKIGLRYTTPLSFAGIRFMLAGLMLAPFWWRRVDWRSACRQGWGTILTVAFFQTFLLYGLFYLGISVVSGALAAIIIGASPLTTALLAHYCMDREPMTVGKLASLGLGLAGVVLISVSRHPWASPAGLKEFGGILLLLFSTLSSAFGNILVAKDRHRLDPILLNSVQIFVGGLLLFGVSVPVEGLTWRLLPPAYYGALAWLSALSAIAFSLWFVVLKRPGVSVSQLNLWKFLIPVCGAFFSWLLLPAESPHWPEVAGMAAIALAIACFHLAASKTCLSPSLIR